MNENHPTTEELEELEKRLAKSRRIAAGETLCLRQKLGQKAKQEPKFRFYALYDRIYRQDVLEAAWTGCGQQGRTGRGWSEHRATFGSGPGRLEEFLKELQAGTARQDLRPQPVRRVYIPKANGKMRPLGIPTVETGWCRWRRC